MAIEQFKFQIGNIPLWARLLGKYRAWFRARGERKQPVLVATLRAWTWWTDAKHYDHQAYACYKNAYGRRWYKYYATSWILDEKEKRTRVFVSAIDPWLSGNLSDERLRLYEDATRDAPKVTSASA